MTPSLGLRPPIPEGMVHPPCGPCEYVESTEGQSRPVHHTFDDGDEVEECEPTANGEVVTGVGEGTQWCVKARATMVQEQWVGCTRYWADHDLLKSESVPGVW